MTGLTRNDLLRASLCKVFKERPQELEELKPRALAIAKDVFDQLPDTLPPRATALGLMIAARRVLKMDDETAAEGAILAALIDEEAL